MSQTGALHCVNKQWVPERRAGSETSLIRRQGQVCFWSKADARRMSGMGGKRTLGEGQLSVESGLRRGGSWIPSGRDQHVERPPDSWRSRLQNRSVITRGQRGILIGSNVLQNVPRFAF